MQLSCRYILLTNSFCKTWIWTQHLVPLVQENSSPCGLRTWTSPWRHEMESSGEATTRAIRASTQLAIATTLALMSLVRSQMNGPFLQFQRSLIQVRRCASLHAATSRRQTGCSSRTRQLTAVENHCISGTCTGHGVQACSPHPWVQMMLASSRVPIGRRTLAWCACGVRSVLSRRSSLKLPRLTSAHTAARIWICSHLRGLSLLEFSTISTHELQ